MIAATPSKIIFHLLTTLLAGSLLLTACSSPGSPTDISAPSINSTSMAAMEATATIEQPASTEIQILNGSQILSLDPNSLAAGFQSETLPAVTDSENAPYWEVLPEFSQVTLEGYPINQHLITPQIFIYPVKELSEINEGAGQIVTSLQALLQSPQELPTMPFLPLYNAAQVLHVQLQYLDFQNGQGLRYLAWFSQGIMPVNNYELIYTYQGITSDGKYYIAAVLPVNHPSLPADGVVTGNEPPEFSSDYPVYLANVVSSLNPQSAESFTPDLTQLDAMMSSLEIK